MKRRNILIVFAKNPEHGKVKTRLAATIGADAALEVYKQLLLHTRCIAAKTEADKIVFYSGMVANEDLWKEDFRKATQEGDDLGERMMNAFRNVFRQGYKEAVIIGTDCPQLTEEILNSAFDALNEHDVVIGPAYDGGYYLLGMKELLTPLFEDIKWSTPAVFNDTAAICKRHNIRYALLPALHDVDEEKDLIHLNNKVDG